MLRVAAEDPVCDRTPGPSLTRKILRRSAYAHDQQSQGVRRCADRLVVLAPGCDVRTRPSVSGDTADVATARHERPGWGPVRACVSVGVLSLVVYLAWLGWDTDRTYGPDGKTGPYEAWQVVGAALSVGAVVAWAGWRGQPGWAAVVALVVVVVTWSVIAATDPNTDGANLWPVGAALLAPVVGAGTALVAFVADGVSRRQPTRRRPRGGR